MIRDRKVIFGALLGLGILFTIVALLGTFLRAPLTDLGAGFIARFGILGMGAGSFIAEAVHFPVAPQFYMLALISSDGPQAPGLVSICAGTVLGDLAALALGHALSGVRKVREWLAPTRATVEGWIGRHAVLAAFIGAASPVSFATQCNVAGLYALPRKFVAVLLLLRVPRLLLYYWVLGKGWSLGA